MLERMTFGRREPRTVGAIAALGVLVGSVLPACTATANVSDVWMSIDEDGARRRSTFFTDSVGITCVAEVGIGRKDVTIEMLVRQLRTAPRGTDDFEPVDAVVVARDFRPEITKDKPALVTLALVPTSLDEEGRLKEDEEAPFNAGSYVCEVYLDGEKQKSAAFNIDYAPCPTAVILEGAPCVGFYTLGTECPANGATGQPEPTCTCGEKGWSCP
jgi:hypothetical protein